MFIYPIKFPFTFPTDKFVSILINKKKETKQKKISFFFAFSSKTASCHGNRFLFPGNRLNKQQIFFSFQCRKNQILRENEITKQDFNRSCVTVQMNCYKQDRFVEAI